MAKELENPKDIEIKATGLKIKFNPGGVIAALIRSGADIATSKPAAATFAEWVKAISFETEKEQEAFTLVAWSMQQAIEHQLSHKLDGVNIYEEGPVFLKTKIRYEVFNKLKEKAFNFDCNHLSNPTAMNFLVKFKPAYQKWLIENFLIAKNQAAEYTSDFPHHFAYYFSLELLAKEKEYQSLLKWCDNPQNKDVQIQLARFHYRAMLKKKYHQPALGEKSVSLSDIYIEPNFLVFEKMLDREKLKMLKDDVKVKKSGPFIDSGYPDNIHQYLLEHFIDKNPCGHFNCRLEKGQVMVLLGQPGHGKSSFCYRSINDLLNNAQFNGNAFFLRLQNAGDEKLEGQIGELAKLVDEHNEIDFMDWVDKKHRQVNVLFLDGLDELYMTQGLTEDDIVQFIRKCNYLVKSNEFLRIIITTRFNYVETTKLHHEDCLILSLDTMSVNQQQTLTKRFTKKWKEGEPSLTAPQIRKINKTDKLKHVKELIELPILLQMVLMANVPVEESSSRGAIYDKLFEEVLNRKWSDQKRLEKYIQDDAEFEPKDLREYLAFLAFKTFQGQKGYLRKSEIAEYAETKEFSNDFLRVGKEGENFKQVLKDILTSFYLKESHKKNDDNHQDDKNYNYVIEFLHKSLYEYLACEHIWNMTVDFFLEKGKRKKPKTRTLAEVQQKMQQTYATIRHTQETHEYLKEIIAQRTEQHQELAHEMSIYFPELLKKGFLHSYNVEAKTEDNNFAPEQLALHASHNYTTIFYSLNLHEINSVKYMNEEWGKLVGKEMNNQVWEQVLEAYAIYIDELTEGIGTEFLKDKKTLFAAWAKKQMAQPSKSSNLQERYFENWVRRFLIKRRAKSIMQAQQNAAKEAGADFPRNLRLLSAERLPMQLNLGYLEFVKSDFIGFLASKINLSYADLKNAYLINADLSNANLSYANLWNVYLSNTFLWNANLKNAYLINANLINANLINANLSNANLINANLKNADLSNADLRNAYLSNADLSYAYLSNADLRNAYLSNANLSYAYLSNADLRNAYLSNADLRNAYLSNAVVESVNWFEKLEEWVVVGLPEIIKLYVVNPELVKYVDRYGIEREGYRVVSKE